jgi:hypothetical protein
MPEWFSKKKPPRKRENVQKAVSVSNEKNGRTVA